MAQKIKKHRKKITQRRVTPVRKRKRRIQRLHEMKSHHILLTLIAVLFIASWVFGGYQDILETIPNKQVRQMSRQVQVAHASTAGPSVLTAITAGASWNNATVARFNTNDASYADCTGCGTTGWTKLTAFGFSIPSTATINSITVLTNGLANSNTAANRDFRVALSKDGTNTVGTTQIDQRFAKTDGNVTTAGILWDTTWNPAEVNATTFGVFYADDDSTSFALQFDYVTVTIDYSTAADATWVVGSADFKIYQDTTLTFGAGTPICTGTLTDDNTSTISCTSSAIAASTQYRVEVTLKNAGEVVLTMDGASEYVDHKNVKAGWAGTNPTLGTCAFSDVGGDDTATTACTAAWNSNDVRITETGSGNVKIGAVGTQKYAYLITTDSAGITKTNSTSYYDTSIDSVAEDSSKITITGPNALPTGSFNSATQKTDGTGKVDISITANDTDGDLSKAKVEYVSGSGCTGTWANATLATPVTATYSDTGGVPSITATAYQVGNTATTQIKTASGANTVTFVWNSATDVPTANTTYCLRLTVNDGTADQSAPATQTLTVDNVAPTAPGVLTDGGKTRNSVTTTFGTQTTDTNFSEYRVYYKQGTSGVTTSDTQHSDGDLAYINYNGTTNTTVSGLSANTAYVFNIWGYDAYGNKTAAGAGATSSGPLNYGTFADDATVGSVAWSNPSNATGSNNGYATAVLNPGDYSHYLKATGPGFSVSGTINGIVVAVERKTSGGIIDDSGGVYLIKNGTISGDNKASSTQWTTGDTYETYGSSSDLWGQTWTPGNINAADFGFVIAIFSDSTEARTASIDHIRVTVYYTAGELTVTTSANLTPNGTLPSAAQKTDGTGVVDISTTVADSEGDLSKAKVQYVSGGGCSGTWAAATLQTPISATYNDTGGAPDINNSNPYQVGTTATTQIKTSAGTNTVDFDWASATDIASGNGTYCLRLTVNDFADDDPVPATRTLTIDNVAPTAPGNLTNGGTTATTITLTFGAQTTETNFSEYKIYYKQGASGVTQSDTLQSDGDLAFINYNTTTNTVVSGLTSNTQYVFNIWAYDSYGHSTAATEIAITTSSSGGFSFKGIGWIYSASIDTDSYPTISSKNVLRAKWTQSIPTGCTLNLYMRGTGTGPTPDYATSSWAGPYSGSGTTVTQNLTGVAALQGFRYYQYRVEMNSCNSNTQSAELYDIAIDFD